jgi:hypothetical protein
MVHCTKTSKLEYVIFSNERSKIIQIWTLSDPISKDEIIVELLHLIERDLDLHHSKEYT